MQIKYKDKNIEFEVRKSDRKTICIKVDSEGKVKFFCPAAISDEEIKIAAMSKAQWIIDAKNNVAEINSHKIIRKFEEGSTFMYLGNEYPLHIDYNSRNKKINVDLCLFKNRMSFVISTNTLSEEKMKKALEMWYRMKTKEIVLKIIKKYEDRFKDKVSNVRVKEQKRRWASCTWQNAILFNWKCCMADEKVVEYIVVHEMCHFEYRNHSKQFWDKVAEIIPDYEWRDSYLKENSINMYI